MRTSKEGFITAQEPSSECCMCGDFGLSSELFRCKVCKHRSQHRYCSNLYPKAESYGICNWCVKDGTFEKAQNSSNSSSSCRNTSEEDEKKIKKRSGGNDIKNNSYGISPKEKKVGSSLKLQVNNQIKKQRSPERSPASAARKRVTIGGCGSGGGGGGGIEDRLRRTRSEDVLNKGMNKHVIRTKVRRYKLLEDVSS